MINCALIWLPFNEPTMPPLGIASLAGYLYKRDIAAHPLDLNIEFYSQMKNFYKNQPKKIVSVFNSWSYNPIFQQAASAIAFPDQIEQPTFPLWEKLLVYNILKEFLVSAVEKIISQFDVVGISVTNVSYMASVALSKLIKASAPDTFIIWGGPTIRSDHSLSEKLNNLDCVDVFVHGPGEEPLATILTKIAQGEKLAQIKEAEIPGLIQREKDKSLRIVDETGQKKKIKHSFPDFSSFPIHLYDHLTFPIQTSIGCPWSKCTFCSESGFSYHTLSLDQVMEHTDHVFSVSDKGSIFFVDSCFNADLNRLEKICDFFKNHGTRHWTCMVRSERLTVSILKKMQSSGCKRIFIGLESFSDTTLKAMEKGCTKLDHLRAFRLGQELNIQFEGNFIVGFPGETADDIRENIIILKHYNHLWRNCRFWISPYAATPGSKIYQNPEAFGISISEYGDETQGLPEKVSRCVPVWNHHWTYQKTMQTRDLETLKLYSQLEICIQTIQERFFPGMFIKKTWRGTSLYTENQKGEILKKKSFSKVESKILKCCDNITSLIDLEDSLGIENYKLQLILKKMEYHGWIAQSNNLVVRTIPFQGLNIP